ncbi:MAG: hypothetical protein K5984_05410, partial [Bacteroidales bacterium]|nr:hypothetical protein [Bacteroidales bacterium]
MNNPFRYVPSEQMLSLAENLSARIASDPILAGAFGEGKMLGILRTESCVLYGFSGNAGGTNTIEGFVPPVFDLLEPEGRFKKEEKEISEINAGVIALEKSPEMTAARQRAFLMQARLNGWIHSEKEKMARNKAGRAEDRAAGRRPEEELTKESQFEKAEFRRGRKALEAQVDKARCELNGLEEKVR